MLTTKRAAIQKIPKYECRDIELQAKMVIFWENWFLRHHENCTKKK